MSLYFPLKLSKYLCKEFLQSLFVIFIVFIAIAILTNFISEMIFFKEKKVDNFIFLIVKLTIAKTPSTMIQFSVYIFLFSGILFFVKLLKNSEISTIKISGLSNLFTIFVPSAVSFFIGLLIIFLITPISAHSLKYYETVKRNYSSNTNLIAINADGLWFKEDTVNGQAIIKADKIINNNFSKLNNVTIYILDKNFNLEKRFDSERASIEEKKWTLEKVVITEISKQYKNSEENKILNEMQYTSTIDINQLKNYFTNSDTVSFWEILEVISNLNKRGYSGDEFVVKLHKYLSLPIYLSLMIVLSTVFTLRMNKNYSGTAYILLAIILGILIYFLNDISIAVGLTDKLPIPLSVWTPIIIISFFCVTNLIKINEKIQ
jgi:lipopolysaccharide export system permease protein